MRKAVDSGNMRLVRWLHELGLRGGEGTVTIAVMRGHLAMARWLAYEYGINPTSIPFSSAAESGNVAVVEWLSPGRTLADYIETMSAAVTNDHYEVAEWLCRAQPECVVVDGRIKELEHAIRNCDLALAELLIRTAVGRLPPRVIRNEIRRAAARSAKVYWRILDLVPRWLELCPL